ncbi:MAG: FKBP-type peptidyl-prolyl cis-trans isomerase [Prevotella sp.]|nr:FKBP-type peptidyl-prolyl cis-trans isomerase [Prevotella sp.]
MRKPIASLFKPLPTGRGWGGLSFPLGVAVIGFLFLTLACSEEEAEASEWDNWQQRNETFFATLADSLKAQPAQWVRLKKFSLDPSVEGNATDYVYAKVIEQGTGTESPAYTDSVRVIYQGRLIPSVTYPQGYLFDKGSVYGDFSSKTSATRKMYVASMTDGFATALQHMHRGDRWRLYVPSDLAYGDNDYVDNGVLIVPGHSVLIFDLMLIDFSPAGEAMSPWSSRQR